MLSRRALHQLSTAAAASKLTRRTLATLAPGANGKYKVTLIPGYAQYAIDEMLSHVHACYHPSLNAVNAAIHSCTAIVCFRPRYLHAYRDGIGPEISDSVKRIYKAAGVPIEWEEVDVTPVLENGKTTIPKAALDSIHKNKIALKGGCACVVLSRM